MTAYERRRELSIEACKLFFKNVDYLRKKQGISLNELGRRVSSDDFRVSGGSVSIFQGLRGAGSSTGFFRASTLYLAAYADYFGVSIAYLFSRDLAAEDSLKDKE